MNDLPFVYETSTACHRCGGTGVHWKITITREGPCHLRAPNGEECLDCREYLHEQTKEHVKQIQNKSITLLQTGRTKREEYEQMFKKITDKFNKQTRALTELNKPDHNADLVISPKEHTRFQLNGTSGINCEYCKKQFVIDANNITAICPFCGEEQKLPEDIIML